jgi:dienelactone hydrolase
MAMAASNSRRWCSARRAAGPSPAVIVFPSFMGRGANEEAAVARLAGLGYAAILADLYGGGRSAADREEAAALMAPLVADRALLRERLEAVLAAARSLASVDGGRIAAAGFCFGGLCALDLARSGADIAAAASFHGLLSPPPETRPIRARVAVYHGWDDPLAPPEEVMALGRELTAAGADWQIHCHGGTMHGFTNPKAAAPDSGILHNPTASRRAWRALEDLLEEAFG